MKKGKEEEWMKRMRRIRRGRNEEGGRRMKMMILMNE
jgi:hypothetical protein